MQLERSHRDPLHEQGERIRSIGPRVRQVVFGNWAFKVVAILAALAIYAFVHKGGDAPGAVPGGVGQCPPAGAAP